MDDPTIIEYLKQKLNEKIVHLSSPKAISNKKKRKKITKSPYTQGKKKFILLILGIALLAQLLIEFDKDLVLFSIGLYGLVLILISRNFSEARQRVNLYNPERPQIRYIPLIFSVTCTVLAFVLFNGNRFSLMNVSLWIFSIFFLFLSIWKNKKDHLSVYIKPQYSVISLVIFMSAVVIFMRIGFIESVPKEMFSDHAEKLLDVSEVLQGRFQIFFPRNTGREAIQFYLTAGIIKIFRTGLTFLSLKIGMVVAGLFTLPYIYLIAKELKNSLAGIAASFAAGVAYWPNVISRVALRFALYPLFTAPTIYYLLRGIKSGESIFFFLSGLFLGLGLQGYSPFRIVPFLVAFYFIITYFSIEKIYRKKYVIDFSLLVWSSILGALPLLRYAIENPMAVGIRALSRVLPLENAYPTAPLKTFFENTWKALTMFFFDNGEIWVHSIPHRPALDWISAAIFFIGLVVVVNVIFRNKKMDYLFILISILILMLPSIMSLAFPSENPSLNRTAAAYIPVFVIIGIGFSWIIENLADRHTIKNIKISGVLISMIIAAALTFTNYRLIFIDYAAQFNKNSWNTSEIGELIVKKVALGMYESNIYVVPYPHWVDTRLVGINAGYPLRDFALQEEDFKASTEKKGEKLYILKPEDDLHLTQLISMLVDPRIQLFESKIEGKNFLILTGN